MTNASAAPRAAAADADPLEAAPELDSLPPELLGVAFAFLKPLDTMPLTRCSQHWRGTLEKVYWKPLFLQDFGRPTRELEETLDGVGGVVRVDVDIPHTTWRGRYLSYPTSRSRKRVRARVRAALKARCRVGVQSLPCRTLGSTQVHKTEWHITLAQNCFLETAYTNGTLHSPDDFETTISKIQNIGKNHLSALGVETNGSTPLNRPTCCWPRRQRGYVRAHFLHELANWDAPNLNQRCVVGEFVVQLMHRARDPSCHNDELLSLETLEDLLSTIFCEDLYSKARNAEALVYICHAEASAAQIERL